MKSGTKIWFVGCGLKLWSGEPSGDDGLRIWFGFFDGCLGMGIKDEIYA